SQPSPTPAQVWPCPRCTFLNRGHAPSCEACGAAPGHAPSGDVTSCEATPTSDAAPATSGSRSTTSGSGHASSGVPTTTSGSGHASSGVPATTSGSGPAPADVTTTSCLGSGTSGLSPAPSASATPTSGSGSASSGVGPVTSGSSPAPSRDALRQRKLLEDGRRLVALVRAAESQGLPPESLSPSLFSRIPEGSGPAPTPEAQIRQFRSRLGGVLKALVEEGQPQKGGGAFLGPLSLAEAAWAWLEGEGHPDRARRALIGRRKQQVRGAGLKNLGSKWQELGAGFKSLGSKWRKLGAGLENLGPR
ncbi:RNF31 ligase, partial [Orthonyx spaldingii]|nr:RNF31 ligase [Orthonyx spaldingii]